MNDENRSNASIGAAIGIAAALAAQKIAANSGENNPEVIAANAAIIASELLHEEVPTSQEEVLSFIEDKPETQQPEETKSAEEKPAESKQTRQPKKKASAVATVVETIKETKENKEEPKAKDDNKPKKLTRAQAEEKAKEEQEKATTEPEPVAEESVEKSAAKKTTRKTPAKGVTKKDSAPAEKETAKPAAKPKASVKASTSKTASAPEKTPTKTASASKKVETKKTEPKKEEPKPTVKEPTIGDLAGDKGIESILDIKPEDTEIEEGKILKDGVEVIAPVETVNEVIDNIVETVDSEEEGTTKSFTAEFMAVASTEDEKPTVDFIESLYNDDDDDYKPIMTSFADTMALDMPAAPQEDQNTSQYHEYTFGQTGAILDLDQVDHDAFKAGRKAHSSSAKGQRKKASSENDAIVNEIKQEADKRRKAFTDRMNEITKKR